MELANEGQDAASMMRHQTASTGIAKRNFHRRISGHGCSRILQAVRSSQFVDENTTSVIVHHLGQMRRRIHALSDAFPSRTLHALAIKSNPLVEVLREAVDCGMGLEAASMEEVYLALTAGCSPERIVFDSPAKTHAELREALQRGILLNANSFEELQRIHEIRNSCSVDSPIGLRVNTELGGGSIACTSVTQKASKFGVSIGAEREQIVQAFERWDWLTGLHIHVGSQGCELDLLTGSVKLINELRKEIEAVTGRSLDFVDIGGGLPTVYRSGRSAPTPQTYVDRLRNETPDLMDDQVQLVTEFGRSIQAGCGVTFSRVEYVRNDSSMAIVHVGADLLLRPVYAAKDWQHEFYVLNPEGHLKQSAKRPISIAGPLCFSGDIIGQAIELPQPEPGDWIAIRDTGAYTLSMWSRHCNRSIPLVLGFDDERQPTVRILRKPETPEQVAAFWSLQ